ncbi:MAG: PAS domain S-box protein [Rhodocyclaceae bacterium]|nr:PAS domain S-box protein [Rhodocyclaceae bacterium]
MEGLEVPAALVVGIGASAGGLHALRPLLRALAPERSNAYIIAHHRAAWSGNDLEELLAKDCCLPVAPASHGAVLRPGHVYVVPPGRDLVVAGERLELLEPAPNSLIAPSVDRLFRSLAALGPRAIGVVLSGAGGDGAAGAAELSRAGGIVIAQQAEEALQRGMPDATINAGLADFVGNCEQIAAWLNDAALLRPPSPHSDAASEHAAFAELYDLVARASGIDLRQYKESTLRRQATRRYRGLGIASVAGYLDYARGDAGELARLQQCFLVSVSAFFRDAAAFASCEKALRHLIPRKAAGQALRIWVPGCASGEEAYSLAMLVAEIQNREPDAASLRVFATDVDQDGLDYARAGLYGADEVAALGSARRARFMVAEGKQWRVIPALRQCCVFARHDVISNPPFINLDMVSCRNLLIYLTPSQQNELLRTFRYALRPGGLLLLGKSESTGLQVPGFDALDTANKLYGRSNLPLAPAERALRPLAPIRIGSPKMDKSTGATQRKQFVSAATAAIAAYGPPAVLLNPHFEPLHFFRDSQRYFEIPQGSADFTVHALCLPELRGEIKAMCYRAGQEQESRIEGLALILKADGQSVRVVPVLLRLDASDEPGGQHAFLLLFEETRIDPDLAAAAAAGAPTGAAVERLQQELADTREHLQSVIDKLAASNEELQAAQEELQSSTEELQASNEELQASNEELSTLNDELRQKTLESAHLSVVLGNIQNSVRIGLVVVDRDGRVTRFNHLAGRIFGLVAQDVGQFLYGVPCHLHLPDLRADVSAVVAGGESCVERVHEGGFHYLMRIDPYIDESQAIAGAVLTFSDVSDLHRAEHAQGVSELRFRQVWEASMEGLLVTDASGSILLANPSAERMFGYAPGELAGTRVEMLVPEDARARHPEYRRKFFEQPAHTRKMSERNDLLGLRKDGSHFAVALSLAGFEQDGQRLTLATVADVSVARRAIDELRHNEARLRNFVEHLPAAVAMFDRDMHYLAVSRRWCDDYGLLKRELIGRSHYEVFPEIPAEWKAVHARALAGETLRADHERFERGDGRVHHLRWEVRPWTDSAGAIAGIIITTEDVSEIWRAEERRQRNLFLERELNILQGVLESTLAGYWDWNIAAGTEYLSPTFKRMFGYGDDELPNSPETRKQLIFPEDLPGVLATYERHVKSQGAEPFFNEVRYRHKIGSTVWVILAGKVVEWSESGAPLRMVGCHIDVSPLHEKVEQLTLANARADSASRAKSAFLANMSHEIRTPLNAIVGMVHLLRRRSGDADALAMLSRIDSSAAHLLEVITDVLDLAQIEADKLVLHPERFQLRRAVDNVAAMVAGRALAKGLQLIVDCPPQDLALFGDATRYTQSLLNLASNAVKFTESGRVCIRVTPRQSADGKIELLSEVEDTGPGIAEEVVARLFTPFEQGDMSSTRTQGGSGLGLAITRRLAQLMQGDTGVNTKLGQGSTFWFSAWFGVDEAAAQADAVPDLQRTPTEKTLMSEFAGRRILLVEDEEINQEVATLILQDLGLQVVPAADGQEALELARGECFDLVLMDMRMPRLGGVAATRAIRALPAWREVPIVAMTANAFEENRQQCFAAGMNDFLTKPIDTNRLHEVLLRWLRARSAAGS